MGAYEQPVEVMSSKAMSLVENNRALYTQFKDQLNARTLRENTRNSIDLVKQLLADGRHLSVSTSMFKDSATVCGMVITALLECVQEGYTPHPVHFTTIDTLQEMPEAHNLVEQTYGQLLNYAQAHGISDFIRVHIASPTIRNKYQNMLAAGLSLPTYAKGKSSCVADLKLVPIQRVARQIQDTLPEGEYLVSCIGTRIDESMVRKGRMLKSGSLGFIRDVYKETVKDGLTVNTIKTHEELTLIALWDTEMHKRTGAGVMNYLGLASPDSVIPEFKTFSSFDSQLLLYMEGSASECVVGLGTQTEGGLKSSCGTARFGCWNCQKPQKDNTAENQVKLDRYAFKRNLLAIRNWISSIENDLSVRRWIQKANHPIARNYHRISPNAWNAETCFAFLSYLLTADRDEIERAETFKARLDSGRLKDDAGVQDIMGSVMFGPEEDADLDVTHVLTDPAYRNHKRRTALRSYITQSAQVRFQNISEADIIFIDALWSRDVLHPPFTALQLWHRVHSLGERFYPPSVDLADKNRGCFQAPEELYIKSRAAPSARHGMHEPLDSLLIDQGGDQGLFVHKYQGGGRTLEHTRHEDGSMETTHIALGGRWQLDVETNREIKVDANTACFIVNYDMRRYLKDGDVLGIAAEADWTSGYRHWLRLGVLSINRGGYAETERLLMRAQSWQVNGIHGQIAPQRLLNRAVTKAHLDRVVARLGRFQALARAKGDAAQKTEREAYASDPVRYEADRLREAWQRHSAILGKLLAKQIAYRSVIDHSKAAGLAEARTIDSEDAVEALKQVNTRIRMLGALTASGTTLLKSLWVNEGSALHQAPEVAEMLAVEFRGQWLQAKTAVLKGALVVFDHVEQHKTLWGCGMLFSAGFGMTLMIHHLAKQRMAAREALDRVTLQVLEDSRREVQLVLF